MKATTAKMKLFTTDTLRDLVHREYPAIETAGLPEAEIFQSYLREIHGCQADYLETRSTNCGNNITNLLALLREKQIRYRSIILCQDATMQARMERGCILFTIVNNLHI